ncbi:MAG TPA: mechanosensitive ion channel family protein [Steroidobacteraceae bacterium]|nr:mechanosensitive ion channel family protein [Steroidobacteraceae bacterium]
MSTPNPGSLPRSAALALLLALNAPLPVPAQAVSPEESQAGASPAGPALGAAAPMTGPQVIQVLDQTIDWYRTLGIQQQASNEPSDLLILHDNRQTANQVIASAFEAARANAEILANQPGPKDTQGASASSQSLSQLQNKFAAKGTEVQNELDSNEARLATAAPEQKVELQAKISELRGELALINARKSLLATLSSLTSQSDTNGIGAGALKAQIDAMAVTVPSGTAAGSTSSNPASSNPTPPNNVPTGAATSTAPNPTVPLSALTGASGVTAARFGIWDLAANVVRLSEKAATIDAVDQHTSALQATFARIRAPLIDQLRQLSARGDTLAAQADTADSATLNSVRDQLDALSNQFKQTSALLIPLSKIGVLLDQYRRNIANWHDAIEKQYGSALKTLGVRLGVLAVLLAIVFIAAEIWRRAVMRYVQDTRRRYQFLLLRRIALWCLVILIVGFAFASELGSVVTFAGLITAGLAVAMQSVLVSIVGYFFLIGKYGIRVGDRVQIGDVTGEVIDLGLVRLHLMELGGHGLLGPTGRVVAFANSIVFQVSSGLFKQIHGVNLVWREITLSLPAGIDYAGTKKKLAAAVSNVLMEDREEILRQTKEIQRATSSGSSGDGQPRVQLSFSATGVDAHIRYPVHLQNVGEIEERVSQAVFGVVAAVSTDNKTVMHNLSR